MFDLLFETRKLGVKPYGSPMAPSVHLTREEEHLRILRDIEY